MVIIAYCFTSYFVEKRFEGITKCTVTVIKASFDIP